MPFFTKREPRIEAWQWNGETRREWPLWLKDYKHKRVSPAVIDDQLLIPLEGGNNPAEKGDWIIRDLNGPPTSCAQSIFNERYVSVERES